ncbi:12622_t:CDS:2 [Ambispora gerdemannii]|uniref:12622_t:CDS:1 n=1 Tax=Ambispora gerdemannii TaxID=144530 RepID=A0A9N9FMA2_9GLOM|nr:12622_t:CDS:2 [Ambispora gerdemannii]
MWDFVKVEKKVNNFFPTNATSQKELSYYGTKIIKPLKIFTPQYVKKLSSAGGSRDSHYYQIPYLDPITQQIGSFLIDAGTIYLLKYNIMTELQQISNHKFLQELQKRVQENQITAEQLAQILKEKVNQVAKSQEEQQKQAAKDYEE